MKMYYPKMVKEYCRDMKNEFRGYNFKSFFADFLAGITVAAVALPLSLAFGVSSGADASAGLITAIVAAFLIGSLSGASFQISGPTGAMAVILLPLAAKYGFTAVLAAGFLSGIILIVAGLFKAGRLIAFIPRAVITGFTSGIAIVIALGQVENLFGVPTHGGEAYMRIINMFTYGDAPSLQSLGIGLFVIFFMMAWPKKWNKRFPSMLVALIIVTVLQIFLHAPVATVGDIPKSLIHENRLGFGTFAEIPWGTIIVPAISIALLGMIESLLCGTVGGKMKGEKLRSNRELVAQGIGNMVLPFMGGVPATAAIARSSVAIKSGSRTRITGIVQGVFLLLSMFLLAPLMSNIPLAALAGILMVTAWRMNEWGEIRHIMSKKFFSSIAAFFITLICTVVFDLTIAIAVGCLLSLIMYAIRSSKVEVTISEFDRKRYGADIVLTQHVQIIYISGSIFFASIERFGEKMRASAGEVLILSMLGVPDVDASGVEEFLDFCKEKKKSKIKILFCGVQPKVQKMFDQAGLTRVVGKKSFFWSAKEALESLQPAESVV